MQRGVFFEDFVNGDADLVFVGAGFGLDRKRNGRLGQRRALVKDGSGFIAQRFASGGFFQLGDGADVAGMQLGHFGELLALHDLNVLEALGQTAIVIQEGGVIFQHAAHHFEIVDAAGEGIGERFENEKRKRLGIVELCAGWRRPCRWHPCTRRWNARRDAGKHRR